MRTAAGQHWWRLGHPPENYGVKGPMDSRRNNRESE